MFEFFFKYPAAVYAKGHYVLLGRWPAWVLLLMMIAAAAGLAALTWWRMPQAVPKLHGWRGWALCGMQVLMVMLVLLLLWQPAINIAELNSQQNIIAVLLDDSRSMAIADDGSEGKQTREAAAIAALNGGLLTGLQKRFQTRIYRIDKSVQRIDSANDVQPVASATRLSDGLQQFLTETADLPIGAVVLMSDGATNGVDAGTIEALHNRHLPVHTIGLGNPAPGHDVEMEEVSVTPRAMVHARVQAIIALRQNGYAGSKTMLMVRNGDKTLAEHEITLGTNSATQYETIFFDPGEAGVKALEFSVAPIAGEENKQNNALTRTMNVSGEKRRILYIEGEPRWEYKFIRRAEEDDPTVEIVSMLRTTENKIYRQGLDDPKELADGFPSRAEDLFQYQGIIIGSVEANYFSPLQQELLREYVDRRGGGVLFLGGRFALADGGWSSSAVADMLPVTLPNSRNTFHRDPATVELTAAGADSAITRLLDDPAKNAERWKKLTYLMDYQEPGTPKPGATVLVNMKAGAKTMPMLLTQNYGHGRVAMMATSGTWRWQMSEPLGDTSHDTFWQQLLRWLVADSPERVSASVSSQTLMDDGRVTLKATVRDKQFMPAADAQVTAHILGPQNKSALLEMTPSAETPGNYEAEWNAETPGQYMAEITAQPDKDDASRNVTTFERLDGVAENFHTEQNRALLQQLSAETGARYWKRDELAQLPKEISYSEAGISVRDTKELWNVPLLFLLMLALLISQWLLRRRWGVI